ncbi:hypothetical protein [Romboutsia sp.]|uniref:hypothetical protein n=1 Tax=Romboutsia sp. TaxID=1965302 RepID=UPI003F3FB48A
MKKNNKIKDMNEYKKSKKNKNKKRKKITKKLSKVAMAICILCIIISNICGYAKLSKLKYEIGSLETDLKQKNIALEQLKSVVDTNTSTQKVELEAKEKLNMDYPKKEQIRYIEVGN